MKRLAGIVLIMFVCLIGCSSHYYRTKGNKLSIYLKKPDAKVVLFAFSNDGYILHPAQKIDSKTWQTIVPADEDFTYFYIVDGKVFLPPCQYTEKDDFGSDNCIFISDL